MKFCPFCAEELQDDSVHCAYCGKRLPQPADEPGPAKSSGEVAKRTVFGFAPPVPLQPPPVPQVVVPSQAAPQAPTLPDAAAGPPAVPAAAAVRTAPPPAPPAPVTSQGPPPPPILPTVRQVGPATAPPHGAPEIAPTLLAPARLPPVPATIMAPVQEPPSRLPPQAVPARDSAGEPAQRSHEFGAETPPTVGSDALLARVGPMPAPAPTGFFAGLPYWLKVISAQLKRTAAIGGLRREQYLDGRRIDELCLALGSQARDKQLPTLEQPLAELQALESDLGQAEASRADLTARLDADKGQLNDSTAECEQRISEARAQIEQLQLSLKERQDELRSVRQRLAELERSLKRQTDERTRQRAQVAKASTAEQRSELEQAATQAAVAIGDLEGQAEATRTQIAELAAPLAEAQNELNGWRGRLAAAHKDLAAARQKLAQREREVSTEDKVLALQLSQRRQAISGKLLEIGKILAEQRPPGADLERLYTRLDATRDVLQERERLIAQLANERRIYDRQAVNNAKVLVFSTLGLVVAIVLTLVIVW